MSFYDNFVSLCAERQISPSAVAQKAGLDKSIVSYWKKHDNVIPKFENLQKIAAVFDKALAFSGRCGLRKKGCFF